MRRVVAAHFAAFALLMACAGTAAAAQVSASVNMDMVPAGQPVVLTITIHDGDGDPDLSVLRDFETVRSGKSTNMQIINGKRSSSHSYRYMLLPKREGELTIPAIPVEVDGKLLSTKPLRVSVNPAETGEAPRSGQSPGRKVLLSATVSRDKIYLGEPLLYTVSFYTAARVANFRFQPPTFQGFSPKDLGQRSGQQRLGGELYEVHQFPWLLTALKLGNYTIESTRVQCDVLERSSSAGRSASPFDAVFGDSFFGSPRLSPRSLQTKPARVEVLPLPEYSGDVPFSGLVGALRLTAKLSAESIEQGASATLSLTISGDGNVMDAVAPPLNLPAGLKVYMDAPEEDVKAGGRGYSGAKTFRYALVGLEPGVYDIGPVRMAWFDTEKSGYVTEETEPMKLTVAVSSQAVRPSASASSEAPRASGPREVTARYQDILPLKDSPVEVLQNRPPPSVWVFLAGLVLPPLAYLSFAFGLRLSRRDRDKARELARQARVRADEAADMAGDEDRKQELYAALRQALLDAVLSPTGSPSNSLTREEMADALQVTGREAFIAASTALLDELDAARFAGRSLDADARVQLAGRVRSLVKEMTA